MLIYYKKRGVSERKDQGFPVVTNCLCTGVLDKKGCLKASFGLVCAHGKGPCFSALGFLLVLGVDCQVLILLDVDGDDFLD